MRALLYVLELSPLLAGPRRTRLRRLDRADRTSWLSAIEKTPRAELRLVYKLLKGAAQLS